MKRIHKQASPENFERWVKQAHPQKWEELAKVPQIKQELSDQLRLEQGRLCCYCERRIDKEHSHIEHLRAKDLYPQEMFQYNNLFSCCGDKHSCGHKKDRKSRKYSEQMVMPLNEDCEGRFIFDGDGQILPTDKNDQHAQDTIEQLGLNSHKLRGMRKIIYMLYLQLKETSQPEEYQKNVNETLQRNADGEYAEFWTTIKYVAEKA